MSEEPFLYTNRFVTFVENDSRCQVLCQ